ncbi:ribonuclease BN (tRNA processing enzyme) [Pullulanibacillus pueri]|uniref:Nucleotide modification associated domain-containing protein n=1 Tax=Pullulanibacillus pueri TaxID=1437324 RepID=A0A8J3EMH4_9BACL|nr:nucleotide modification associated domain-containing protein [Pullulanibacillus pueri]MBM7681970.1 ribonuclease BN (tRNA processing enzyme) [Pullulanibacillus pueri]GGH83626.1 hypothetical protein GCM10007096_24810 [Pullulanibacillus pueri]
MANDKFEIAVRSICHEIADTIIAKNHDYGNSFSKLYQEFGDLSVAIRLSDKVERFKSLLNKPQKVKDESKIDTLRDIAGYVVLRLVEESVHRTNYRSK